MAFDIDTLFKITLYVESLLGLLLLFAWVQNTAMRAVCWWGFGHLIRAFSVVLFGMYGHVPDLVSIDVANALLFTSFAATWTGSRVFDGRPGEPVYFVTGAVVWLLLCRLPALQGAVEIRGLIACLIIAGYTWLTAYEFWRGSAEQLVSRWPAVFVLFGQGALFLLHTPLIAILPRSLVTSSDLFGSLWLTILSFEGLMFTIAVAFILLAMAKERTELRHRTAAMLDPLTGIANRRAFLLEAEALAERHAASPRPTGLLLMDLDHFKSVNDRFGHAVGDRVLEAFTGSARDLLGEGDLFGRLGGEEFAVLLPGAGVEVAFATAERVRQAFAAVAAVVDGYAVGATVSIGIAHCEGPIFDVTNLLAQADRALYLAKENGRDRVEIASLESFLARAGLQAVRAQSAA